MNDEQWKTVVKRLKAENLLLAQIAANHSRMRAEGKNFRYQCVYDGKPVWLFYDWEEVWRKEKLEEFREGQKKAGENLAAKVESDLEGVVDEDPDNDIKPDTEAITRNVTARMEENKADGDVKRYGDKR